MSCEKTCNMQHRAKKRAKTMQNHAMQNHAMPKPCKKQAVPHVAKNKLFHMSCKNHAKTMQKLCNMRRVRWRLHRASGAAGRLRRQLSPGSLLYVLYVLYLTRQATEHPLSPGSLLYVLYVLYLTRQATEHPLSPSSLLYVLYVLYGPI